MPKHSERRRLPYRPEQMFALVADIERYPEFLPWCVGARIRRREGDTVHADLDDIEYRHGKLHLRQWCA